MSEEKKNREAIYDERISPLMTQIIATCKEYDIPMLASFELDDDRTDPERPGLACTTAIVPSDAQDRLKRAYAAIYQKPDVFAFTITSKPKGEG